MLELLSGNFFGETDQKLNLDGITLTKTVYTHDHVDWHYHENAYFTFLLRGCLLESGHKNTFHCGPGGLLFHYWQDAHCNIKPPGFTRGFHAEISKLWFDRLQLSDHAFEGSFQVTDPAIIIGFYNIVREAAVHDTASGPAIESLLVNALSRLAKICDKPIGAKPVWVRQLQSILHEEPYEKHSLSALAARLDIHPVHLSRDFQKHFHSSLGDYIRRIRIQNSIALFQDKALNLTEIAFACGFADQSHFLRCFKSYTGIKSSENRKSIHG